MSDLEDKVNIMCEVLLYHMAFNRYFNYKGQYSYIDLYFYILRVSDNTNFKDVDITKLPRLDIKYQARYIK